MKATFFERVGAYLIDLIILSFIATIVCSGISQNNEEMTEKLTELNSQLQSNEITNEEYFDEYMSVVYENQKDNIVTNSVTLILTIGYYIVFQGLNKGQTLGKKLLKIKVVDNKTEKKAKMTKYIIRSLFVFNILSSLAAIVTILLSNKKMYIYGYGTIAIFEIIFIFITLIFMLYTKDGRGLHDKMAGTKVIKEEK